MLGKLIKHEWKSTYRMGCLMLFITLIITFMGWLSFQSPVWRRLGEGRYTFSPLDFISTIVLLMYVFMLVGVSYGILIYLGVHFYRTMYTDQGYLTHTLPVGKHQLLCSKILVCGLWLLIVYAAVVLSGMTVVGTLVGSFFPDGYVWADFWDEVLPAMGELFELLELDYGFYLVIFILSLVVSPFITVTILFGAVTLGQLFARARVLMAILCYLGVGMVNSLVSTIVQSLITVSTIEFGTVMNVSTNSSMIVQLAAAVLLYFTSYQILTKRLNMQ